jgi:predicted ribonuclease YlaK
MQNSPGKSENKSIKRTKKIVKSGNTLLAYATSRLTNQKLVASVKFQTSVRSDLAKIGVELL